MERGIFSRKVKWAVVDVPAIVQLLDTASKALKGVERQFQLVDLFGRETTIDGSALAALPLRHYKAVPRLQALLASDIRHQLSNVDLVRIDNLCRSSLVLGSMIFAQIDQANPMRKLDMEALRKSLTFLIEQTAHIELECTRLENLQQTHAFDDELQASSVYSGVSREIPRGAEMRNLHASTSTVDDPGLLAVQSDAPSECTDIPSSSSSAEFLSMTSSFMEGVPSLSEDRYGKFVRREVHLEDDNGDCQLVCALLDTGANQNFITEAKVSSLKLGAATRKQPAPVKVLVAGGEITATLVVKGKWRFPEKDEFYTHGFHVVPDLGPYDVIICRQVVLEYGILEANPELCSLLLPDELQNLPELLISCLKKLPEDEAKEQKVRTKAKEEENKAQREKEAKEARERLARASSSNAPAHAGNPASSSGSSNTTK